MYHAVVTRDSLNMESTNQIKDEMGRAYTVAQRVKTRKSYTILVGKPEGMRPPKRPRHRWEDNIKMDGKWWDGVDRIHLTQNRELW
jgi:hypothetical protein